MKHLKLVETEPIWPNLGKAFAGMQVRHSLIFAKITDILIEFEFFRMCNVPEMPIY